MALTPTSIRIGLCVGGVGGGVTEKYPLLVHNKHQDTSRIANLRNA